MKTVRAFIALELPEDLLSFLENVQSALKRSGVDIRWVASRNIHLTLRFLGDIPTEMREPLEEAIEAASHSFAPFRLAVKGLGVFPSIKNARVLWAGLSGETALLFDFQHRLENCLGQKGIEKENRPFKAHLTLGRINRKVDPARLLNALRVCGDFEPEYFNAGRVVLFKSDLKPAGAVYTRLYTKVLE